MKMWNELAQGLCSVVDFSTIGVKPVGCMSENEFKHSTEGGWNRKVITAKGTELFSLAS
jgi:hypothetical protein